MFGGEMAAEAALEGRCVPLSGSERDPYGLGWVVDWLYGDASAPPEPLPPREPVPQHWRAPAQRPLPPVRVPARKAGGARRPRRPRQLALL